MLVHLRLNVPSGLTRQVEDLLVDDDRITNVTIHAGASRKPAGDVVEADIAREAASAVLDDIERTGLCRRGGVVLFEPIGAPFEAADEVDRAAHGDPDDAVIWRIVQKKAEDASHTTFNFLAFLIIATALASIAVLTDSSVLVVGAMVVGPEFAAVAAVCVGLVLREWRIARRAAWLLLWSFAVAIAVIAAISWIGYEVGFFTRDMVTRPRPQTGFIWRPDKWSFVVACWAGAAGVLAIAIDKTNAMVGVFISVTTVPAAGNLALGIAVQDWPEIGGSLTQLGLNICGMLLAGVLTLVGQRVLWRRIGDDRRHRVASRIPRRTGV